MTSPTTKTKDICNIFDKLSLTDIVLPSLPPNNSLPKRFEVEVTEEDIQKVRNLYEKKIDHMKIPFMRYRSDFNPHTGRNFIDWSNMSIFMTRDLSNIKNFDIKKYKDKIQSYAVFALQHKFYPREETMPDYIFKNYIFQIIKSIEKLKSMTAAL